MFNGPRDCKSSVRKNKTRLKHETSYDIQFSRSREESTIPFHFYECRSQVALSMWL